MQQQQQQQQQRRMQCVQIGIIFTLLLRLQKNAKQ
jgi:hypothetical protein